MNCNVQAKRHTSSILIIAAIAAFGLAMAGTSAAAPSDGSSAPQATQDTSTALVQLNGDPLSTYAKTKPAQGKKVDFNSNTVKSYRAQLSALRNDYKAWLRANVPQAKVTGEETGVGAGCCLPGSLATHHSRCTGGECCSSPATSPSTPTPRRRWPMGGTRIT